MFERAEAAAHLSRRGLVPAAGREGTRTTLDRIPGRNLVYRISIDGAPSLLLKQAVDDETRGGLEREARAYDRILASADPVVAPRVPRKLDYDPGSSTLVLEFLVGHRPLGGRRGSDLELDAEFAAELGEMLAGLHSLAPPAGESVAPWILSLIHPPVGILREATEEHLELVGHVQHSSTWRKALGALAEEWRPRSFVHGDLRFSNVLVGNGRRSGGTPTLKLIDWELADPGASGWDTGWIVAEILAGSLRDIEAAFPHLGAFWAAYADGFPDAVTPGRLDTAVRWAAAAMLQMAYEAAGASRPTVLTQKLLEVGRSLLERPEVWTERILSRSDG